MYLPDHFALTRPEDIVRVIGAHPLGMLVTHGSQGLGANHVPFAYDPEPAPHGRLIAHVARANPLWREVASDASVLVVFRGADGYISPNWYPSKQDAHRQVPTWNYEVVHAHGRLVVHDDARFVRGVVARLTRIHEAASPTPWKMGDAPADYLEQMVAAIVGIEVVVERWEGKAKLGQNKEARDRAGAVQGLRDRGHDALADAMQRAG
jgi:transcriptional regulator